jgi:Excinuclease ATPase subunit
MPQDYIIDLGLDGGSAGGFLTFQGLKKDFCVI